MTRYVDLSFAIEDGMPVYPEFLPEARVGAFLEHDASRSRYGGQAEFHITAVEMVGNTGTYLDTPFHRHRHREDLAGVELERLAGLSGVIVDAPQDAGPVTLDLPHDAIRGRAVLFRSGWDRRWRTDAYWEPDPWLAPETLDRLIESRAALVGVDWTNVDDTADPARPAHTRLLDVGILIVEHLRGLDALPSDGFRFFAVPPAIVRGASFTVRAFAELPG